MYLWPIAPKVWIVSQYPAGSAQEQSIAPALKVLAFHGHTIHRVPGLESLIYDDINTMPNYANGVILSNSDIHCISTVGQSHSPHTSSQIP